MSGAQNHGRDLARLREKEAALRKELGRHQSDEAKALEDALKLMVSANKAVSQASRNRYGTTAQRARKRALDASRKSAEITEKIAQNERRQVNKLSRLRAAERAGHFAAPPEGLDHAPRSGLIATVAVVDVRRAKAAELRVLYVTAHSDFDVKIEAEVRQVQQALRGANYRDRIEVQSQLAATLQDLLDGLHEVRPHIVHFSGHGGGATEGGDDMVDLVRALAATEQTPTVLIMNTRDFLEGASVVLPTIPLVIGLPDRLADTAATVFALQFYAATARGQSVGAALRHGKLKMQAVLLDDDASEPVDFIARHDVDLDSLLLVQPVAASELLDRPSS